MPRLSSTPVEAPLADFRRGRERQRAAASYNILTLLAGELRAMVLKHEASAPERIASIRALLAAADYASGVIGLPLDKRHYAYSMMQGISIVFSNMPDTRINAAILAALHLMMRLLGNIPATWAVLQQEESARLVEELRGEVEALTMETA